MDHRRLSTGDVLSAGIINIPAPSTDIPRDREELSVNGDEVPEIDTLIEALEANKLLRSPEYYGIPSAWKSGENSYRGVLLQYRSVTEDNTFTTAAECAEWFRGTTYSVAG